MIQSQINDTHSLGADLRALRKARGMTLADLAHSLNKSVGWLSQVERGLSEPTVTDLRHLSRLLDVPVSLLFGQSPAPSAEAGRVVRARTRRAIGPRVDGLTEELLSPDLTDDFEMVHSIFAPHSKVAKPVNRPTQEVGYMISGQLNLRIDDADFTVGPGDSFRIKNEPFQWSNPYDIPAVAIWVIAPPVY